MAVLSIRCKTVRNYKHQNKVGHQTSGMSTRQTRNAHGTNAFRNVTAGTNAF
jgi:hypothetical protein